MKLSEYIKSLERVAVEHGDIEVMKEATSTEMFRPVPSSIGVVMMLAEYIGTRRRLCFDCPEHVEANAEARREFKALVL